MSSKTVWDKHGNRIGEDVITTDRDGLTHITHYDNHGNRIGRSFETRDNRGEIYMIHEDARGNRLARSTVERDWWGDYYVKTEYARSEHTASEQKKRPDSTPKEDTDESAGAVGDALYGVVMLILKVFGILFIGLFLFQFVFVAGCTIWPFVLMPLLNRSDSLSTIGPAFVILIGLFEMTFWPYTGILLYRRWKKKIGWKDFFFAVLRWAIIGPVSYRWLLGKKKEDADREYDLHRPYDLPLWSCPTCGKNIFTAGRFCPDCGTERPERPSFFTVSCPNCGKSIKVLMEKEKTGVCSECGYVYNSKQK